MAYKHWRPRFAGALGCVLALFGGFGITGTALAAGPNIQSGAALVIDHKGNRLYGKNTTEVRPIASVTKLMTAMVVLDAEVPLEDLITIEEIDRDNLRHSSSRLRIDQATLSRQDMLRVALMSSDNRAASALGRTTFGGGTPTFVAAMNAKARALGMRASGFVDPAGLGTENSSTAEDLVRMINAAARYPLIRQITSTGEFTAHPYGPATPVQYRNTNPLVRDPSWVVELSKTGYINEAGRCLVMQATVADRRLYIVLLNAPGKHTPFGDSQRLREWLHAGGDQRTEAVAHTKY